MNLEGQTVLVVGLGKSGLAAARLLCERGARVIANDRRDESELGSAAAEARAAGAELRLGAHDEELFRSVDRIVVSPGVPPLAALDAAEAAGVPIASEVELASWFVRAPVVAITGTNGKSTVTTLLGEMCRRAGRPTFVGGNLGTPLVSVVDSEAAGPEGRVVVELSSFQLERIDTFRPHVAVLLNVSDDHLDRYHGFADYAAAKGRIFENQRRGDVAVVHAADGLCLSMARAGAGSVHTFGAPDGEVRVEGGRIVDTVSGLSVPTDEIKLRGGHNADNACAAALAARVSGVSPSDVESVLREFPGLAHRMQHVVRVAGVDYYDDSKATNVGAAAAALDGLTDHTGKVVLIAGGKHKGGSYEPLVRRLEQRGRALVLMGEAAELIARAFDQSPVLVARASGMEDAVRCAHGLSEPGDIVMLSPACSSFDMFRSYVERGEAFQAAARSITEVG